LLPIKWKASTNHQKKKTSHLNRNKDNL